MRNLLACAAVSVLLIGCGANAPADVSASNQAAGQRPERSDKPQSPPDESESGGPVRDGDSHYPDHSAPDHVELSWSRWGGRNVALVCEKDHIEQLPDDTTAVSLNMVLWYDFGREARVGDAEIAGLKRLPNLEYLSVGVEIGDEGFRAISELPALQQLSLASFYKVTAERLELLQNIKTLKELELHMQEDLLDEDALKQFREARPDVKIIR